MVTKINIVYSDLRHSVLAIAARSIYPTMATAYIIITMPNTHWPCRVALCVQRFARWKNGWFFFFFGAKIVQEIKCKFIVRQQMGNKQNNNKNRLVQEEIIRAHEIRFGGHQLVACCWCSEQPKENELRRYRRLGRHLLAWPQSIFFFFNFQYLMKMMGPFLKD